jgi:hypothetical protein
MTLSNGQNEYLFFIAPKNEYMKMCSCMLVKKHQRLKGEHCSNKPVTYVLPASNVALTIVETFQNKGNITFFQGIQHTPTFPFDRNQTAQTHVLQMVRGKGLFAAQHVANFGYRQFGVLFEQVNDAQAHRVSNRFEDCCDAFQFFRLFVFSGGAIFVVQYTTWCFHTGFAL